MGGGTSLLVAERVREFSQTAGEAAPDARRQSVDVAVPSIASRVKSFERRSSTSVDAPLVRPAQSAAAARLRRQREKDACAFCGMEVFAAEARRSRGALYHAACLRCGRCGISLADTGWATLEGDDVMYCDGRPTSCLRRLATAHLESLKEAENQRLTPADEKTSGQAKLAAVEAVGEELERIVAQLRPSCALCGGAFGAKDRLVMQGMVKFHEACMRGAAPETAEGFQTTPSRAMKDAPARFLIKVEPRAGAVRVITFFLAALDEGDDDARLYGPDDDSRAPRKRRVDVASLDAAKVRFVSLGGAELCPPASLAVVGGVVSVATARWTAAGLAFELEVAFAADAGAGTVALRAASLRVR